MQLVPLESVLINILGIQKIGIIMKILINYLKFMSRIIDQWYL